MKFNGFEIVAFPHIMEAVCKHCGEELREVSDGWVDKVLFCPKCENVYTLKLVKLNPKKIDKEFIEQCREETKREL